MLRSVYFSYMATKMCESCMMPLDKDPGVREHDRYCSLCFQNGELMYKGDDLKEFQDVVYRSMRSRGESWWFSRFVVFMIRFAPRWRTK